MNPTSQRPPRPSDFLRAIEKPKVRVPDPAQDFGMYAQMSIAFHELREYLDGLRANYGRVGYSSQNLMSDLTKAYIDAVQRSDDTEADSIQARIQQLSAGYGEAVSDGAMVENPDKFISTMSQEHMEAKLFGAIWPVIAGRATEIPQLPYWREFQGSIGNVQAYLYGYLDVVSELGKSVADELSRPDITTEQEFQVFERFLAVASSITLQLSDVRHVPGYIINNGYGRWMSYPTKLRTAYGTIAHVRREYNLRRSIQRMVQAAVGK